MKNNDVQHYTTPSHIMWEGVGSEVVILDTTSHTTHRLTGEMAQVFRAIATNTAPPDNAGNTLAHLADRGLLTPPRGVTRRHVVAGLTAGGIMSLALPPAAAATSSSSLPITSFVFDAAFGDWRWQQQLTTLVIAQFGDDGALKETDIFIPGDVWTVTLINAGGKSTTATVVGPPGADLSLPVQFVNTPAGSYPTTLRVQLSRNTGTEILQSQEFDVIAF